MNEWLSISSDRLSAFVSGSVFLAQLCCQLTSTNPIAAAVLIPLTVWVCPRWVSFWSGTVYINQSYYMVDMWLLRSSPLANVPVSFILDNSHFSVFYNFCITMTTSLWWLWTSANYLFSCTYDFYSTVCPGGPIPPWTLALRWAVWICRAQWQNMWPREAHPHPGLTINWWDIIGSPGVKWPLQLLRCIFKVVNLLIITGNGISISLHMKTVVLIICILSVNVCFIMHLL